MKVPFLRSIGAKLFGLIVICMVMAVLGVSLQNHGYFRTYLDIQIADDMVRQAQESANSVEGVVENWTGQIALIMHNLDRQERSQWPDLAQGFIASNRELVAFEVFGDGDAGVESRAFAWTANGEEEKRFDDKDPKEVAGQLQSLTSTWVKDLKAKGEAKRKMFLRSDAVALHVPLLSIAIPFEAKTGGARLWAVLTVWQTRLAAALPKSPQIETFMIDNDGTVFASQVVAAVLEGRSLKDAELTRVALKGDAPYGFRKITTSGKESLGAYYSLDGLGMSIVMERDARQAYAAVDSVVKRTALWAWLFVLVSILLSYFVASGMTKNIRLVAQSTQKVAGGDFENLTMPKSRDEIGGLGQSVQYMAKQIQGLLKESVEKARMATELDTAHMVQKTFIPDQSIDCGTLKITGRHQTASECGGDWWGHFNLSPGVDFLCIADATGHGVPAALITAMVYSSTTIIAQSNVQRGDATLSPIAVLQQINSLLWLAGHGRLTMTFMAAIIDSNKGEVTIANAGHNFPAVIPRDVEDERLAKKEDSMRRRYKQLIARGGILGMYETLVATEKSFTLKKGDKILFYTDGMTECKGADGNAWGLLGLNKTLAELADGSIDDMKKGLIETVLAYNGAAPLADDITVVVAELLDEGVAHHAPVRRSA